jgi:uncharacterized protein
MMRVMLDSNILISGIVFSGNERKLINTIYSKSLILVLNEHIEFEVKSVIRKKFPKQKSILRNLLDLMIVEYTAIPSVDMVKEAKQLIRDPKDAIILASAINAQPDIFVTGDLDFHTDVVRKLINVVNTSLAFELIS